MPSRKLANKLYRSIVDSDERFWLKVQMADKNISVYVLRKHTGSTSEGCAALPTVKGGHAHCYE